MTGLIKHEYHGPKSLTRPEWPVIEDPESRTMNLGKYTRDPTKSKRVLRATEDTVLVLDKYPKSKVHLLLLPTWEIHQNLHPHDAFADPAFLQMMRRESQSALKIAMARLEDLMRKEVAHDPKAQIYNERLDKRDFSKDFQIGIHAHPSMHHLHLHIASRDMASELDYSRRHYSSFNTDFLVPLKDYPLSLKEPRRRTSIQNANLLRETFQCWRCGKDYNDDYPSLKQHIFQEWSEWCREANSDVDP